MDLTVSHFHRTGPLIFLLPTVEERRCEVDFLVTHRRTDDRRYIVRLPFKTEASIDIGLSLRKATFLYTKLEHQLARNPALAVGYQNFLKGYLDSGHMYLVENLTEAL